MKQMAHYHPSLPDPCEVCDRKPLVELPNGGYVYEDGSWSLVSIVAGVIGLLCFGVVLWWLVTAL